MFAAFLRLRVWLVASVLVLGSGLASAAPIIYTYFGTASGSLANQSFTNASFLITAQADTTNVLPWVNATVQNTHSSVSIALAGFGTFAITEPSHTWVANNCCMGIGANLSSNWLTLGSGIGTYGLTTNFGPFFDAAANTDQFVNVATSLGALTISPLANGATFQATLQAAVVPLPGALVMMLAGLAGIAAVTARRRRG